MKKRIKKFFIRWIFISTLLISSLIVLLKLYIPEQYQFIEPISMYWTILSSVIFIYWFILAPAISEYKESEKLIIEIKNSLFNIKEDANYFKWLKNDFDEKKFLSQFSDAIINFYESITSNKKEIYPEIIGSLQTINLSWERLWIPANHIIRIKQELSNLRKCFLRINQIKEKESLPIIIHKLKNFITFIVIITLLFLNIWTDALDYVSLIQESVMLFLISFLYIYLSFVINGFDNPFDKWRFSWYIDLSFLKDYCEEIKKEKYL